MMETINFDDARQFLKNAQAILEEDEVNGNLILGISNNVLKNEHVYGSEKPFYAIAYNNGVSLMGVMTPPHKLLLYKHRNFNDDVLESFANNVYSQYKTLPGVTGETSAAQPFAKKWAAIANCGCKIAMKMRAFKLTSVNAYTKPRGIFRMADHKDLDTIIEFVREFSKTMNEIPSAERINETVKDGIANGEIYVWENEKIAAMAKKQRETKHGMAISYVYTPKEYRNNGYATAVVSELSRNILESGKTFCTLFTDLSNPVSNSIYQKIGYMPVSDSVSYAFEYSHRIIIETDRLKLRELQPDDRNDLCEILQDKEVMYAYEHAFSDEEVKKWFDQQIERYHTNGHGLWAVIHKETNAFLGQCGLTIQQADGEEYLEIGYLFKKEHWRQGYATEAALACKKYAFEVLHAEKVCSIIRDTNISSQNVAKRLGMVKVKEIVKHYYNMDMPHYIFQVCLIGYKG
jgi:RimJ/RimL family protein N-acetyltransferase